MRIPIEELDLSIRAYNVLKSCDVDYVDEIRPLIDSTAHPLAPKNPNLLRVRDEIFEKLRGWDDDHGAGVPSRI
jgi:DNA-directed RNA polymerase alpha subunit